MAKVLQQVVIACSAFQERLVLKRASFARLVPIPVAVQMAEQERLQR